MYRTKISKGMAITLGVGLLIVPLGVGTGQTSLLLVYFLIQSIVLMFHTHELEDEKQEITQAIQQRETDVNELIGFIEEKRDLINLNDIIKYEKILRTYRSNKSAYNRNELIDHIQFLKRFYDL